jgi:hypothetical protein
MPSESMSHPDRLAATLANLDDAHATRGVGPFALPGPGSYDCRIDLKILQHAASLACSGSARARERLAAFAATGHPDLWAGTVQDGVARGFAIALEEAISLGPRSAPEPAAPTDDPVRLQRFAGKDLRKKKDLLVASGGTRVRFSRKEGLLFVDRNGGVNSPNCLRFEARRDLGSLDGFVADEAERPRLYSAQFLQAKEYVQSPGFTQLRLAGRIGRGPIGWDCQLVLTGVEAEDTVRMRLHLDNRHCGWRLRARFLGVPSGSIAHDCAEVREVVENDAGGFVAFTLVRSCGTLLVDGQPVEVPGANVTGTIEHRFRLG